MLLWEEQERINNETLVVAARQSMFPAMPSFCFAGNTKVSYDSKTIIVIIIFDMLFQRESNIESQYALKCILFNHYESKIITAETILMLLSSFRDRKRLNFLTSLHSTLFGSCLFDIVLERHSR